MISAACHKKPLLLCVSGVKLLYRGKQKNRQFCETSAEVTNYVTAFCAIMQKPGTTEMEF